MNELDELYARMDRREKWIIGILVFNCVCYVLIFLLLAFNIHTWSELWRLIGIL
jgi:hypothetical protein